MASPTNSETLGGTPEASEFGAALRDMRQAHNTDISTVASTLRIRQVYLQAIEEGRFDDLPGPTYAAGFVRAYAEFLGLDIAEVMRRYRDVTRDGAAQAPLVAPSPVSEGRMPTGFILLVAAVLAGVAYGSWYYLTVNGRDAGDLVAQLPQRIADLVGLDRSAGDPPLPPVPSAPPMPMPAPRVAAPADPVPAPAMPAETTTSATDPVVPEPAPEMTDTAAPAIAATAPDSAPPENEAAAQAPDAVVTIPLQTESDSGSTAEVSSSMAETAPAAGSDGGDIANGIASPPSPEADPPAMAAPEPSTPAAPEQVAAIPPTAPVTPSSEAASRVILRATAISWVELRDVEGKRVFSRLLKKGETYNVPSNAGITLATGNAGALDILVDGRPIGPIGPIGAVRRDVLLEPEALLRRVAPGQ